MTRKLSILQTKRVVNVSSRNAAFDIYSKSLRWVRSQASFISVFWILIHTVFCLIWEFVVIYFLFVCVKEDHHLIEFFLLITIYSTKFDLVLFHWDETISVTFLKKPITAFLIIHPHAPYLLPLYVGGNSNIIFFNRNTVFTRDSNQCLAFGGSQWQEKIIRFTTGTTINSQAKAWNLIWH